MNVKVKFFDCRTKGLNWRIITDPFPKVQCDLIFGRNKRDKTFIPLVGMNDLADHSIVSLTKNAKGTYILTPSAPSTITTDILIFTTIEGGFRGGVGLYNNGGTIIAEAQASAACESAISAAVLLKDKEEIIFQESGRYGTFYHIFINQNGNAIKNKLAKEDFNYLYG